MIFLQETGFYLEWTPLFLDCLQVFGLSVKYVTFVKRFLAAILFCFPDTDCLSITNFLFDFSQQIILPSETLLDRLLDTVECRIANVDSRFVLLLDLLVDNGTILFQG